MVQVSDKCFCEPLVVIVKIEARLEVWVQRQTEPICSVSRIIVIKKKGLYMWCGVEQVL